MLGLKDRVALVTGAGRGIGRAIAQRLAAAGAICVLTARSRDEIEAVATPLGAFPVPADVRREEDVTRLVEAAHSRFGRVDLLVNNAAIDGNGNVAELAPAKWRDVLDTNLTGVFLCCRAVLPGMIARRSGTIVNIASLAGTAGIAGKAAYCASKAGLLGFTDALMQEVRPFGIRVAAVSPGSVNTGFGGPPVPGDDWKLTPEDVAESVFQVAAASPGVLISRVELRPVRKQPG